MSASTADGKACRRRFTALLDTFRRVEMESLRASGTAEEYREREQLTNYLELFDDHVHVPSQGCNEGPETRRTLHQDRSKCLPNR
ncbi:hypothetical protein F444_19368 [Phytophthora nicotianae P1976]|uniref:Uncharacterized protein n=1 Tax=Phytophthora nicotianae P1976 TaxID=1317066 RepID=A0A080Z834_PHYNI|nr:hypothetical protein F444_19368 [Phytophthora nicotianae P1976]